MGAIEANAIATLLNSNVGLAIGVLLCLLGLYKILVSGQAGLGWVMIIVGVSIPFLVPFMQDLQGAFCPVIQAIAGTDPNPCISFAKTSG